MKNYVELGDFFYQKDSSELRKVGIKSRNRYYVTFIRREDLENENKFNEKIGRLLEKKRLSERKKKKLLKELFKKINKLEKLISC